MLYHRKMKPIAKTHTFLSQSPYFPDLAPGDFYLFADFNKMFAEKIFGSNEATIAETMAYIVVTDKSPR